MINYCLNHLNYKFIKNVVINQLLVENLKIYLKWLNEFINIEIVYIK